MANEFGIDAGNVLSRAEEIAAARIRNKFLPKALELEQQAAVRGNAMGDIQLAEAQRGFGDENAMRGVRQTLASEAGLPPTEVSGVTISPQQTAQLKTYISARSEEEVANIVGNLDKTGKAAAYIKSAKDPAKAYLEVKGMLPAEIQKQMPAEYDPEWADATLAHVTEATEIINSISASKDEKKDAPSGYEWDADGKSLRPIKGGPHDPSAKGAGGLETAAANGIRSTVALAFDGEYDPQTGEFSLLDPTQANRMVEAVARAQEIAIANPGMAPGRAVSQALAEVGVASDPGASPDEAVAKPTTQAEFDALPKGAKFIDPDDGKTYVKK